MMLYLLKVNILLAVFFGFSTLLFGRDTFFRLRRAALLASILMSWLLPAIEVSGIWSKEVVEVDFESSLANIVLPVLTVNPESNGWTWVDALKWVWLCGLLWMLIRLVMGLSHISRMSHHAHVSRYGDLTVYLLQGTDVAPCSFFRRIFLPAEGMKSDSLDAVLKHESVHARQWHSVDVLLAELTVACCWMNPFAWLLRNEIRANLEYLADEGVVACGTDVRTYAYHLLALACPKNVATYTNNFTVLPLKKRIQMMNKQRTKKSLRMKYLLLLPVGALLLMLCNLKVQATPLLSESDKVVALTDSVTPIPESEVVGAPEVMPSFPGGLQNFMMQVAQNVKYPEVAQKNKVTGRVIVNFVITKEGEITNAKVVRSLSPECDAAALSAVKQVTTRWTPGTVNGLPVNTKFTIPIKFQLQK